MLSQDRILWLSIIIRENAPSERTFYKMLHSFMIVDSFIVPFEEIS